MEFLIFAAFGTPVALLLYGGWYASSRTQKRREAALCKLVEKRGGTYYPGSVGSPQRAEVPAASVSVRIDFDTQATRWQACHPFPGGPRYRVAPRYLTRAGPLLTGGSRIDLGIDPAFDKAHVVRTETPSATRNSWTKAACELVTKQLPGAHISSDGRRMSLVLDPGTLKVEDLEAGLALLDILGGADLFGRRALQTLPGAQFISSSGPWDNPRPPRAVVPGSPPVEIQPVYQGGRVFTVAVAHTDEPVPALEPIELPRDGPQRLPEDALESAATAGPCVVEWRGGRLWLLWPRVELDHSRLLAGAALLQRMSPRSGYQVGVFR